MSASRATPPVDRAIADLAVIRRALDRARVHGVSPRSATAARRAHLLLQGLALALSSTLLVAELATDNGLSVSLAVVADQPQLATLGFAGMAVALALLVGVAYFVVWRSAVHGATEVATFVSRNFAYLRNLGLVSDVAVRFLALALVAFTGNPTWVAALLCAYVGDYLVQGRFFTLPVSASLWAGVACLALAGLTLVLDLDRLAVPLALFAAVDLASLVVLVRMPRTTEA